MLSRCGITARSSTVAERLGANRAAGDLAKVYIKNGSLTVKHVDVGTTRDKYLDLTGTCTSWVHSLVES